MILRRIVYLCILIGCTVFYLIYKEWLSWILLMWVLMLPVCSLLVSLPAMLRAKLQLRCPELVQMGQQVKPELKTQCRFPMPPVGGKLQVESCMNRDKYLYDLGEDLQTVHCGTRHVRVWRLWIYDYMGLLRRRVRYPESLQMTVFPMPLEMEQMPPVADQQISGYKPKVGGGFSENHDLRLYRPGDDLKQLHWKLSAKTGKLILREPLQDVQGKMVLSVALSGTAFDIDEKLGKLLWLSRRLLQQGCTHEIRCLTKEQLLTFAVEDVASLDAAMKAILTCPVSEKPIPIIAEDALWQYHIGGGDHET